MKEFLKENGAKLVVRSVVPWWILIIYKVLKKRYGHTKMAAVEPDGPSDRTVSKNNSFYFFPNENTTDQYFESILVV